MRESLADKKVRAKATYRLLTKNYPNVRCELDYANAFQLLVATVLSAQCTDKRVNQTTPVLFKKYNSIKKMASADQKDIERLVKSTGFFRDKAKNIKGLSQRLMNEFNGERFGTKKDDGLHVNHELTQEELAQLVGASRETVNKALADFASRGWVKLEPRAVVVLDYERLSKRGR